MPAGFASSIIDPQGIRRLHTKAMIRHVLSLPKNWYHCKGNPILLADNSNVGKPHIGELVGYYDDWSHLETLLVCQLCLAFHNALGVSSRDLLGGEHTKCTAPNNFPWSSKSFFSNSMVSGKLWNKISQSITMSTGSIKYISSYFHPISILFPWFPGVPRCSQVFPGVRRSHFRRKLHHSTGRQAQLLAPALRSGLPLALGGIRPGVRRHRLPLLPQVPWEAPVEGLVLRTVLRRDRCVARNCRPSCGTSWWSNWNSCHI